MQKNVRSPVLAQTAGRFAPLIPGASWPAGVGKGWIVAYRAALAARQPDVDRVAFNRWPRWAPRPFASFWVRSTMCPDQQRWRRDTAAATPAAARSTHSAVLMRVPMPPGSKGPRRTAVGVMARIGKA